VQNQNDSAVAENGSAADQIAGDNVGGKSLDDQFFFSHQLVHQQAETFLRCSDDNDEILFGRLGWFDRVNAFQIVQANQRENVIAQTQNFSMIHPVNFLAGAASNFDD